MSHLALEALDLLKIHKAQAAKVHSAFHLSVEQLHYMFKERCVCVCVCVCVRMQECNTRML